MGCSVNGCDGSRYARGWCRRCYSRWQRNGDPTVAKRTHGMTLAEKMDFYTETGPTSTGCVLWTGNLFSNGYGQLFVSGRKMLAHRVAYELKNGTIPEGCILRHKCDVRRCVNPDHLETGTHRENTQDMIRRNRDRLTGERSATAKLTAEKVRYAREAYAAGRKSQHEMAREWGLSVAAVHNAIKRKTWKHVD